MLKHAQKFQIIFLKYKRLPLDSRYNTFLNNLIIRFKSDEKKKKDDIVFYKYEDIPISNIRNFSIIAHVDHGKSTLADRLLEITGTLNLEPDRKQVLDRLQVERERGITVKAVTASLQYISKKNKQIYLLNLVDTPGHVDFSNEVIRSLTACQSVILLVDAKEGVQAQTFANFYLAFVNNLIIIPVLNKVDLKNANTQMVGKQLSNLFEIEEKDILKISAKLGTGIIELLERIVSIAPAPPSERNAPLKALLFDSWFEKYRGVIILLYIQDGEIKKGDIICSHHTGASYTVNNVGIVRPNEYETDVLKGGQIGYVTCNMQSVKEARIGDTFYHKGHFVEPFPGFKPLRPMVFSGIYPIESSQYVALRSAIDKLTLTDSAVTLATETSPALGHGWRLGFLGLLHLEVFNQRLDQEYGAQTIMTAPSVTYKVRIIGEKNIKKYRTDELEISNPVHLPDVKIIKEMLEPTITGTIIAPFSDPVCFLAEYLSKIVSLCAERRGEEKSVSFLDESRVIIQYILPLNEIVIDFHDKLKNISSGFASFDYENNGYVISDLVKIDLLLNGEVVEELCSIVHRSKARKFGHELCEKLTEIIPRKQFKIAIQAAIGTKIIARENIKPYRKDVTQNLYGGDATRRYKLLHRQAEGKRKMRMIGKVEIPRDAFIKLLKT
ncbi:hypothetical protein PGB90_005367 [Kerria lacca]